MTKRPDGGGSTAAFADALGAFATGVTLVTVADGRDDIGTTVSAFCPVSLDPPLVLVSLIGSSYPAEVLGRADSFAVTLLASGQRALAGRFAVAGRPGARLMLDGVPHHRGAVSGALIADDGLAALECEASQRVTAGDHLLVIARVVSLGYIAESGDPLIRYRGRYPALAASAAARPADPVSGALAHRTAQPPSPARPPSPAAQPARPPSPAAQPARPPSPGHPASPAEPLSPVQPSPAAPSRPAQPSPSPGAGVPASGLLLGPA